MHDYLDEKQKLKEQKMIDLLEMIKNLKHNIILIKDTMSCCKNYNLGITDGLNETEEHELADMVYSYLKQRLNKKQYLVQQIIDSTNINTKINDEYLY